MTHKERFLQSLKGKNLTYKRYTLGFDELAKRSVALRDRRAKKQKILA